MVSPIQDSYHNTIDLYCFLLKSNCDYLKKEENIVFTGKQLNHAIIELIFHDDYLRKSQMNLILEDLLENLLLAWG